MAGDTSTVQGPVQEGAAPAERLLTCSQLVIGYGGKGLLPPIQLEVPRGTFLAVVGRNGSGKSTFFKTLLGLLPPVSGQIVKGSPRMKTAYVPQTSSIDPILPVRPKEMVLWGRLSGWNFLNPFASREDRHAAEAALDSAGARPIANRPYRELSEGQKQRALLARVLATEADLVLLDEPTAAMDAVAERETMQRLAQLARSRRISVVVVSHDLHVSAEFADSLLFFDKEGGTVVSGDARTVFCHPSFRHQYGDEYCTRSTPGTDRGPVVG